MNVPLSIQSPQRGEVLPLGFYLLPFGRPGGASFCSLRQTYFDCAQHRLLVCLSTTL